MKSLSVSVLIDNSAYRKRALVVEEVNAQIYIQKLHIQGYHKSKSNISQKERQICDDSAGNVYITRKSHSISVVEEAEVQHRP